MDSFPILCGLATLIYAGLWMVAAPSRVLGFLNKISVEINRFEPSLTWREVKPIADSVALRVALRFIGLGLIVLGFLRLIDVA